MSIRLDTGPTLDGQTDGQYWLKKISRSACNACWRATKK